MGLFAGCCFEIGFSSFSFQRGNAYTRVHQSAPESTTVQWYISGTSVDISGHQWSAHPATVL